MAPSTELGDRSTSGRRIVIVIGPGRSGTSTLAGALAHCGFEVPGRAIRGNTTNPVGFYEPRWVVDYHRDLLKRLHVGTIDSAPEALDIVSKAMEGSPDRDRLRDWLAGRLEEQPRLVVKDPRSIWFQGTWISLARELDAQLGFVTMLRHPAEVSASRKKYYSKSEEQRSRDAEITRISGWVNGLLTAELVSRGSSRAFVRYSDLITDWRDVLGVVGEALQVAYDPDISAPVHPVDDFIDPSLHRVSVGWGDTDVPDALRDIGERVWQTLSGAAEHGEQEGFTDAADRLRMEYARMCADARALTLQSGVRSRVAARRRGEARARREMGAASSSVSDLKGRLRQMLIRGNS